HTNAVVYIDTMNPYSPCFIASPVALELRLIFLPCSGRVDNPDLNRFDKIRAERAGILNRWMAALRRLYERGSFDIPASSIDEVSDYLYQQDAFDHFIAEKVIRDPNASTPVA